MTVLIDSWTWIEYFIGKNTVVRDFIEGRDDLVISTINLAEVYRFMLTKKSQKEALVIVEFMKSCSFFIPVSDAIALKAAEIRHEKKFGLGDAIVLATALSQGVKVVTGDSDFKNISQAIYLGK